MNITPLQHWGLPGKDLYLAAGPCSAESEEQLLTTARALSSCNLSFLRAGLWKPRTRPGSFEGVGIKGLEWMVRAREQTGIPIGVEVASPEHVEACLKHNVDVVWIGARTTTNPFAIQALADALKGSDMRVLVKNPMSPDVELWIGAVERINNAGITRLGVIHRGFSSSRKVLYRFAPNWKIPIEFRRRHPDIPMFCDPSHICGQAKLIYSIAQEALDLLYDGLMIEVHPDPPHALSDAKQQLTPDAFRELLARLTRKTERSDSETFLTRMDELRHEVDSVDDHIIELLGKRMEIVRAMGELKRRNGISTFQPHRWEEILDSRLKAGEAQALSQAFLLQVFQAIHEEAIEQQTPSVGTTE